MSQKAKQKNWILNYRAMLTFICFQRENKRRKMCHAFLRVSNSNASGKKWTNSLGGSLLHPFTHSYYVYSVRNTGWKCQLRISKNISPLRKTKCEGIGGKKEFSTLHHLVGFQNELFDLLHNLPSYLLLKEKNVLWMFTQLYIFRSIHWKLQEVPHLL